MYVNEMVAKVIGKIFWILPILIAFYISTSGNSIKDKYKYRFEGMMIAFFITALTLTVFFNID